MDRVELLRNARTSYSVIWTKFIKAFEIDPDRTFCFFEGEDAKYYGIRIDTVISNINRVNLSCNGKQSVLKIFELIRKDLKYSKHSILFFIDRDYDDVNEFPKNENLYITPSYSIENFYVTKDAFSRILQDELQISPTDTDNDDYTNILSVYSQRLAEFIEATTELNAWIYTQTKVFDSTASRLNIENVELNKLVDIKLEKVSQLYDLSTLHQYFPESLPIDKSTVDKSIYFFSKVNKVAMFRGKYKIEFLRLFIELLKLDNTLPVPNFLKKKRKIKINLSKHNLISELSQYADTPTCLLNFLKARTLS